MKAQRDDYRGFTLVELLIALFLGLLVTGGAISVFLANQQVYRQNEGLARLQESGRYAFEVMARDLRKAGGVACGRNLLTVNLLNSSASYWWANWNVPIQGFDGDQNTFPKAFGSSTADRISGTDAVIVLSGTANDGVYIVQHVSPNPLTVPSNHGISSGVILD